MGIFSKDSTPKPKVSRNTFDMSFSNNLTMQFGKLYPTFVKEVLPNDTFKIGCNYGLRFMPTAFPIQSKIKFRTQFFYVRNRNLWDGFPNFWTGLGSQQQFPYVSYSQYCKTGELGDYLGLPTTLKGAVLKSSVLSFIPFTGSSSASFFNVQLDGKLYRCSFNGSSSSPKLNAYDTSSLGFLSLGSNLSVGSKLRFCVYSGLGFSAEVDSINCVSFYTDSFTTGTVSGSSNIPVSYTKVSDVSIGNFTYTKHLFDIEITSSEQIPNNGNCYFLITCVNSSNTTINDVTPPTRQLLKTISPLLFVSPSSDITEAINTSAVRSQFFVPSYVSLDGSISSLDFETSSVISSPAIPIEDISKYADGNVSALPFRAYESIYNAFYRDDRNNPYKVNGVVEPNVYLPTKSGGLDSNFYELHHCNWEQDFLTTSVESPQLGPAPLVGITSTSVGTFQSEDGTLHEVQFKTSSDGDTITGVDFKDMSDVPQDVRASAMNLATEGISISDFRSVNSYQRWLEVRLRSGLKYRDQIAGHFGITPSYAELDMPEFIGGFSSPVSVSQVNQTSSGTDSAPLGSYAGQMFAVGSSNNEINFHCDEPGFIIGISYIVPTPIYSQLMPKHFLKFDRLDYFFPTFANLGYQPIKLSEVAPLQAVYNGLSKDATFGYQQAWYDYKASTDECHGLFRTLLSDFLLMRTFATVPSLQNDFLTVQQDQLNQVFTVNTTSDGEPIDPALGQLHFQCIVKREVPRVSIPRLE